MEIVKNYDFLDYLKKEYWVEVKNTEEIKDMLIFLLFWNKIESWKGACPYDLMKHHIEENISGKEEDLDKVFWYFFNQYNDNNHDFSVLSYKWDNKFVRGIEDAKFHICKRILEKKEKHSLDEKITFVAYLIASYRIELFHGAKEVTKEESENFIMINNFLCNL